MTPYEVAEIIDKEPLIASLLYDIDLLPEQIKEGDGRRYSYMLAVIGHMQAALKASLALYPQSEADQRDAARYRWINKQHNFLRLRCGEPLDSWVDARIEEERASLKRPTDIVQPKEKP